MKLIAALREGQGPLWAPLKGVAKRILTMHVPVGVGTRPVFQALYSCHVFCREIGIWAIRFFYFEPLWRSKCHIVGKNFQMESLPYMAGNGLIKIGDDVRLSGKQNVLFSNRISNIPEFSVGAGTFIGHDCSFHIAKSISIGKHCLIATGVAAYDYDGHAYSADERRQKKKFPEENCTAIVIGDDVWIGARAMILKGVTIGDGAIVGSGCIVTKDVPPHAVIAGNPARIVRGGSQEAPNPLDLRLPVIP